MKKRKLLFSVAAIPSVQIGEAAGSSTCLPELAPFPASFSTTCSCAFEFIISCHRKQKKPYNWLE